MKLRVKFLWIINFVGWYLFGRCLQSEKLVDYMNIEFRVIKPLFNLLMQNWRLLDTLQDILFSLNIVRPRRSRIPTSTPTRSNLKKTANNFYDTHLSAV